MRLEITISLIGIAELAEKLGLTDQAVRNRHKLNKIPGHVGGNLFHEAIIDQWLMDQWQADNKGEN